MKCRECKGDKPEKEFHWKDKEKGRRSTQCKDCYRKYQKGYQKKHYPENKADYIRRRDEQRVRTRKNLLAYLKEHPCVDCDEPNPIVLEFDHCKGKKEFGIARALGCGYGWNRIREEIEKCEVVCSNCHKKRTAKQFGWHKGK